MAQHVQLHERALRRRERLRPRALRLHLPVERTVSHCRARGAHDGRHSMEEAAYHTERAIAACHRALADRNVLLEGTLLKPYMVRQGTENAAPYTAEAMGANLFAYGIRNFTGIR